MGDYQFTQLYGLNFPGIVFSFIYNKIYIKELLEKGYRPANEYSENILSRKGIISTNVAA